MRQFITGQITIREGCVFVRDIQSRQRYEVAPESCIEIALAGAWIPGVYAPDYDDGQIVTFALDCPPQGFCGLLNGMTARMEVQA